MHTELSIKGIASNLVQFAEGADVDVRVGGREHRVRGPRGSRGQGFVFCRIVHDFKSYPRKTRKHEN
jgi:hypothetical protein